MFVWFLAELGSVLVCNSFNFTLRHWVIILHFLVFKGLCKHKLIFRIVRWVFNQRQVYLPNGK